MGDARHHLGRRAEDAAATWLERHGWTVLARRHRVPATGEIDVVALDPAGCLVALEVRARRSGRTGAAAGSIDARRAARLERTLAAFARDAAVPHAGLRVDLVAAEPLAVDGGEWWRMERVPGIGDAGWPIRRTPARGA